MLVLGQVRGEITRLTLPDGSEILVRVTKTEGSKVYIGYTAPPEVKIERQALWLGHKEAAQ